MNAHPMRMTVFMHGRHYAVESSRLLASGEHTPLPGEAARGACTFLFRTEEGDFFAQHRLPGGVDPHDERVWIEAVSATQAALLFAQLDQKHVGYEEAFP